MVKHDLSCFIFKILIIETHIWLMHLIKDELPRKCNDESLELLMHGAL